MPTPPPSTSLDSESGYETASNQFIRRFAASILLTGVNAGVILTFSPSVFSDSFNAPILRTAFAILILGLIASLARMWFLTFRDRS